MYNYVAPPYKMIKSAYGPEFEAVNKQFEDNKIGYEEMTVDPKFNEISMSERWARY